jgi:hypothetical protein
MPTETGYPTGDAFADLLAWRDRLLQDTGGGTAPYQEAEFVLLVTRAELTAALRHQDPALVALVDQLIAALTDNLRERLGGQADPHETWECYYERQRRVLSARLGEPGADTLLCYALARVNWQESPGPLPLEEIERRADDLPAAVDRVLQILAGF